MVLTLQQLGLVQKDTRVQIKRSNGNTHEAIVTDIDMLKGVVHVEWFEEQDIKGKELGLPAVFELNPHLKPKGTVAKLQSQSESRIENRKSIIVNPGKSRLVYFCFRFLSHFINY